MRTAAGFAVNHLSPISLALIDGFLAIINRKSQMVQSFAFALEKLVDRRILVQRPHQFDARVTSVHHLYFNALVGNDFPLSDAQA